MKKLDPLPDIYLDMDGVLVDFETPTEKIIGKSLSNNSITDNDWKIISSKPNFWSDLPWMHDGKILWDFVKHFSPHILSAYPPNDKENAIRGKRKWIIKNLHYPLHDVHLVERHEKQQYAMNPKTGKPNILIDDYQKNIDEWRKAGGIPVHHVGARSTIMKLKEMGYYK
jgi:hypothetical protein